MPLTTATEDSTLKCSGCGHVIQVRKGQLVPPCTRCGGTLAKFEGPPPDPVRDSQCRPTRQDPTSS